MANGATKTMNQPETQRESEGDQLICPLMGAITGQQPCAMESCMWWVPAGLTSDCGRCAVTAIAEDLNNG